MVRLFAILLVLVPAFASAGDDVDAGALIFADLAGNEVSVEELLENGPIILDFKGPVSVNISGVTEEKTGPIALCRCGKSSTKPFCDGAHRDAKFEAPSVEISAT